MIRLIVFAALAAMMVNCERGFAQGHVAVGGLAFGDYYYVFDSPTSSRVDANGFTLRRTYLTADFRLSERYDGRLRFEANQGSIGSRGMEAFVKDLYIRRKSQTGHALLLGIMPPPLYDLSESVWGYRSLEATILDFTGVADSRDFGIRADGPLLGERRLEYGVMFGNNNAIRPEDDRGKRVTAQLRSHPGGGVSLSGAVDYARFTDERETGVTVHGFAGYQGARVAAGVEPFWHRLEMADDLSETRRGISLFAHWRAADVWRLVGRIDFSDIDSISDDSLVLGLIGVSYEPERNVRFMPNLWVARYESDDAAELRGRLTFEFSF